MALLNFKLGNFAGLATTAKNAGTVYITKDEKAMYVDVDNSTRIRIGDIIQINSVREATPPFTTEALYYFIEENALLKWVEYVDEENGQTKYKWQQLNSVSDLQTNISNLTNTVNSNSSKIASLESSVSALEEKDKTLNDAIVANQEAIASNDTELADLTTRMSAVESTANTTASDLSNLQSTVNTLSSTVVSHGEAITDLTPRVQALEDAVGDEDDSNTILGRLKNDEAAISANTTAIGTDTTKDTVKYRIKQLETLTATQGSTLTSHEDAITALQEAVGTNGESDSLASRMTAVENKNAEQDTAITAAQTQANQGVTDAAAAQKTANSASSTANSNASRLTTLEGDSNVEGSVAYQVAAEATLRANADTSLSSRIDTNATNIAANKTNIEQNTTNISANTANIATNAAAIATLNGDENVQGSVDYKIEAARTALSAEIDADINAANAMNYIKNIAAYSELPAASAGIHIGDTYVVGQGFQAVVNNETIYFNAGDMLIASGVEDDDGNITAGSLSWNHVKTGYDAANEPSLIGLDNKIQLRSHLGNPLNEISFVDGGSGIKATVEDNKITLTMEWGTFGD